IVEMPHFDRLRRQKAVPAREVAAPQARNFKIDNVAIEHRKDGMQWPDPAKAAAAPAHGFGPWQARDRLGDGVGQYLGGRLAFARNGGEIIRALIVAALLALLKSYARGFKETLNRLLGRTNPRPFSFVGAVRLLDGKRTDRDGQPPRPGKTARPFEQKAMIGERANQ